MTSRFGRKRQLCEMIHETGDTFGFNIWLFLSQVISFAIVALL